MLYLFSASRILTLRNRASTICQKRVLSNTSRERVLRLWGLLCSPRALAEIRRERKQYKSVAVHRRTVREITRGVASVCSSIKEIIYEHPVMGVWQNRPGGQISRLTSLILRRTHRVSDDPPTRPKAFEPLAFSERENLPLPSSHLTGFRIQRRARVCIARAEPIR